MLIVESGLIVSGANSYVSDAEYVAYASQRGLTIGADDATREQQLIKAMDLLESYRDKFKGSKVQRDQPLQWPRVSVFIDGYQTDSNTLPKELKRAQMELAALSVSVDLAPSGSIENVQSQSLGELSISYFSGGSYKSVQMDNVMQHLSELMVNGGKVRSVRV